MIYLLLRTPCGALPGFSSSALCLICTLPPPLFNTFLPRHDPQYKGSFADSFIPDLSLFSRDGTLLQHPAVDGWRQITVFFGPIVSVVKPFMCIVHTRGCFHRFDIPRHPFLSSPFFYGLTVGLTFIPPPPWRFDSLLSPFNPLAYPQVFFVRLYMPDTAII